MANSSLFVDPTQELPSVRVVEVEALVNQFIDAISPKLDLIIRNEEELGKHVRFLYFR